jgi:hypothetical protein
MIKMLGETQSRFRHCERDSKSLVPAGNQTQTLGLASSPVAIPTELSRSFVHHQMRLRMKIQKSNQGIFCGTFKRHAGTTPKKTCEQNVMNEWRWLFNDAVISGLHSVHDRCLVEVKRLVEFEYVEETGSPRTKPLLVPLCSQQIPHNMKWDRTRVTDVVIRWQSTKI